MALISLPYAFLGQEPFFVGKIALVTKQKTNEKVERCIIQHGYVKDSIWFFKYFFPPRTILKLYSEEQGSL